MNMVARLESALASGKEELGLYMQVLTLSLIVLIFDLLCFALLGWPAKPTV